VKFKHEVLGPDFKKADIVTFDFGDAEISLVIPEDLSEPGGYIAPPDQKVLPVEPTHRWTTHPFGFRIIDLLKKSWLYRDEISENTVAKENIDLFLVEVTEDMRKEMDPLAKTEFVEWLFWFFRRISVRGEDSLLGTDVELSNMKDWMMPLSLDEIERYDAGLLDWPMLTIKPPYEDDDEANAARDPDYFIYIPLSERLFLYVDHSISMISSAGNPITLPKTEILELKRDILMEILSHIKVTYSPEILALIEAKNKPQ
jgi:hypothetical protein